MTRILKINPLNPEMEKIRKAAAVIRSGGLVVFPTETVYGIGADAFNADACARVFEVKNRPMDNPMIVHISDLDQLHDVAADIPKKVEDAVKILWPGPVTFVLKRNPHMPPTERRTMLDLISVRMPAHPVALRLIELSGPIAAPSANISTKPSGTRAEHVEKDFNNRIEMILDGGDTAFGLESTIIDTTVEPYAVLRPGAFTLIELQKFLGEIRVPDSINRSLKDDEIPKAPGMKYRHYAPDCRLAVADSKELLLSITGRAKENKKIAFLCSNEMADSIGNNAITIRLGSERNLYEIGKNLFDSFRRLDSMHIKCAIIQRFPERGIGLAIMNRVMKASDSNIISSLGEFDAFLNGSGI
jgi:L-threonylcarbamoyladenylate synthase